MGSTNPYRGLDPVGDDGVGGPLWPNAGVLRVLARGWRKRCPRCAGSGLFSSWFRLRLTCPRCGWRFEQEEGGFLGAMTLNYAAAFAVWVAMLAVWLPFTVPDVPVGPMLVASAVVLVAVPLWFYPRSKAIWAAIEFLVARSDPDYHEPVARDPRAKDL